MHLFIGNRSINTKQIVETDFDPEPGPRARLEVTLTSISAGASGDYNSYTLDNVRRVFRGDQAWAFWLALRTGLSSADDLGRLRSSVCPSVHQLEPVYEYRHGDNEEDGVYVATGGTWCTRCGMVTQLQTTVR